MNSSRLIKILRQKSELNRIFYQREEEENTINFYLVEFTIREEAGLIGEFHLIHRLTHTLIRLYVMR